MLAQLSDLHLRPDDPGSVRKVELAVAAVAAFDPLPDAILVSGDVADEPDPAVYARARELLDAAGLPLLVIPGNHDDRDQLRDAFGAVPFSAGAGDLRVVGADTSRPGQDGGRLDGDDLEWLGAELAADTATPTVLALHHPPVLTGLRALDAIGLPAGDRVALADLLDRHPQVQTVACGHVHRTMATALGRAAVLICPGVSSQLHLDLRPADDLPIELAAEPSGIALHALVDGGVRSHVITLPVSERVLDDRALNRALLARQGLLERKKIPVTTMLEQLAGVQAEQPQYPYIGLWSRIRAFDPAELGAALTDRAAVRLWVMRGTIHLTTAADALAMYPLTRRLHEQGFRSNFGKGLGGADPHEVTAASVELMGAEPRTKSELAAALAERWPDAERDSLAMCASSYSPCAQTPPRGLFRQPGQVRLAPLEQWLGRRLEPDPSPAALVRRYLAAFGPATVADMRTWSRVTGLREVFEELRPELRTFRDGQGRELFDIPGGLLPDPDTPAPPRFIPRLDNATLSHDDRSRILDGGGPDVRWRGGGLMAGHLLVDGFHRARWVLTDDKGVATLAIEGLDRLPDDVEAEARALLDFWAPDADRRELVS